MILLRFCRSKHEPYSSTTSSRERRESPCSLGDNPYLRKQKAPTIFFSLFTRNGLRLDQKDTLFEGQGLLGV